ncbi:signal peptidase I [Thermoplasmatales archaeon AK]|nr:signal peptidase I [Thermoplasmatales archaeon AK]
MRAKSLIPFLYVAVWQLSFLFKVSVWVPLIALLIFVPFFLQKFYGDRKFPLAIFLSAVLMAMLTTPALITRTIQISFLLSPFLNSLYYSALLSVSIVPAVFSSAVDLFRKRTFEGMVLSGVLYFFSITPYSALASPGSLPKVILYDFSFDIAFSVLISYIYIAAGRKVLTPITFFFLYSVFSFLNISEKVSPLFNVVWEIISISMVFWISYFILGENIWVRRLLRTKKRVRVRRRKSKSDIVLAAVMALVAVAAFGSYYSHTIAADPTSSMYPEITPGSLLLIEPVNSSSIKVGDVIEFHAPWENGTLFAHEVVNITHVNGSFLFRTRGINNPVDDPEPVPSSDIVGIVVVHIPYIGYALIYGRVTAAAAMVIIMVSVLIEGSPGRRSH